MLSGQQERAAKLRQALVTIHEGAEPRPVGKSWFPDGRPSKHDQCTHGVWMYETCDGCISAFAASELKRDDALLAHLQRTGEGDGK